MKSIFRVVFYLSSFFIFYAMYACSSSNSSNVTSLNGIDESQVATDSSLKASMQNVVAVHLEHPSGGAMEDDTGGTGDDLIPYTFNFLTPQNVEICFQADFPDTLIVLNSLGISVLQMQASNTCSTTQFTNGNYSFKFQNSGMGDVKVRNFFIRQDPNASSPKILINSDCQNCDLSGIQMKEADLSGYDFSGSNFNYGDLSDDDFQASNLSNTSFLETDLTGALFDADNSILTGEQVVKSWSTGDDAYTLVFTFNYLQQGQVPTIVLTILNSQSQEIYSQDFDSNRTLNLDLSYMQGSFNVQNLNLTDNNDDAGVWADICWGNGFASCFHGVMVSFDSFDSLSNSTSQSLLRSFSFSTENIALNFINESNDQNNNSIVIFQKNIAGFSNEAVAWKVIQNVGTGDNHPFDFPMTYSISANDSFGNFTPELDAFPGQLFQMSTTASGDTLSYLGAATSTQQIQLLNNLQVGSIGTNIYKDGDLLATNLNVAPAQKAVFQFNATIWIGPLSQVVQGQVMDSVILSNVNTQLSLLGIASADIIMTGSGTSQSPFQFSLANIVMR